MNIRTKCSFYFINQTHCTLTTTSADLAHLQAFHMRCQGRILNLHWYERVTNVFVAIQTNLPHIGDLIAARRYSLFSHFVCLPADVPCNMALRLWRDTSMKRRIPTSWKRPRGRTRSSWISQIRSDTGVSVATSWRRASDHVVWKAGARALKSYAVQ